MLLPRLLSATRCCGLWTAAAATAALTSRVPQAAALSAACDGEECPATLRTALCQLTVGTDKDANINNARASIRDAAAQGAEFVVLPECWNSPYATSSFPVYAEAVPGGPSSKMLQEAAAEAGVWLVGGSIPEVDAEGRVFNTCIVLDPTGTIVAKHRKVHLFDIDVPGKITFRESDTLSAGDSLTVFDTPWGKVGVGICYDIRFTEMASLMRAQGVSLLVYPGAFNTVTGPAHWELLQRARAVDNQVFVLTASPARNPNSDYQAWGHSSVVDPWGSVVATTEHGPDTVHATLDLTKVPEVRGSIPVSFQKREDLYSLTAAK